MIFNCLLLLGSFAHQVVGLIPTYGTFLSLKIFLHKLRWPYLVMLPLDTITSSGVNNPSKLSGYLNQLKSVGVTGVMSGMFCSRVFYCLHRYLQIAGGDLLKELKNHTTLHRTHNSHKWSPMLALRWSTYSHFIDVVSLRFINMKIDHLRTIRWQCW
jgi:hypothetical protein